MMFKPRLATLISLISMLAPYISANAQQSNLITQNDLQFTLPSAVQPSVPTDTTGIGGSLGRAQGLRERLLGPDRNTLPSSHGYIVARDPRYNFNGHWLPITSASLAALPTVRTLAAITKSSNSRSGFCQTPIVSPLALEQTGGNCDVRLMPAGNTRYSVLAPNRLHLVEGALLIKTVAQPLLITTTNCGKSIAIKLESGAIAMVSAWNGHISIFNVMDSHRDSTTVAINDPPHGELNLAPVRVGHLLEIFPSAEGCGENDLVAYTVLNRTNLQNGLNAQTLRLSYPLALKRFNIARALPADDLQQILKSAAAISYIDREREWNDLTPYAP